MLTSKLDQDFFSKQLDERYKPRELAEQLGMKYKPSREFYVDIIKKIQTFVTEGFLKNNFEIKGGENLQENHYQLFVFNHELYEDPVVVQTAITLASGNNTPIPAPGHKDYIFLPGLGHLMQKLFSYALYSEKDGYIENALEKRENKKKEKSLRYSEYLFLKNNRFLIFPVGSLSYDGKQIKGFRNDKEIKGRPGSVEIAWRIHNYIQNNDFLKRQGKEVKIVPGYVSYYPLNFIRNRKKGSKVTVRFGKSLDALFKNQIVDEFNSIQNMVKTGINVEEKEKFRENLEKKFMDNVMDEISFLININVDHLGSRILYNAAKNKNTLLNNSCMEKTYVEEKLKKLVGALETSNLYLSDHLSNQDLREKAFNEFLHQGKKRGFLKEKDSNLELNIGKICLEPHFMNVRKKNRILYHFNKLEHLEEYKKIEREILSE